MKERIQKLLAQANWGSRRAAETIIEQGRVRVNGKLAKLGDQADPATDVIEVDGKRLKLSSDTKIYIALNKPKNVVSTNIGHHGDERTTIRELIPLEGHLFTIGRLDADSEGLVVLTNDGDLANRLSHPRYQHTKTYKVIVQGLPTADSIEQWQNGMFLSEEEGTTGPAFVSISKGGKDYSTLKVVMTEGKKRQIRRIAQMLGHPVKRLVRTHIGMLELGNLEVGEWRELDAHDVKLLSTPAPELRHIRDRKRKLHGYPPRGHRPGGTDRPRRDAAAPTRDGERKPMRASGTASGQPTKRGETSRPTSSNRSSHPESSGDSRGEKPRKPMQRRPPSARAVESGESASGETRKPSRSRRPASTHAADSTSTTSETRKPSRSRRPASTHAVDSTDARSGEARKPSRPRRPPSAQAEDSTSATSDSRKPSRPRRPASRSNDASGETRKPSRPRRPSNTTARGSEQSSKRRTENSQKSSRTASRSPRKRDDNSER